MMSTSLKTDLTAVMADHLATLRAYATSVFVREEPLSSMEADDKDRRIQEFLDIGSSFRCSPKELVVVLYKGLLR